MWPTPFGISLVVAFVWGSFIWWQRLRDDYDGEKLLTLWLWLVVAAWVGSGTWACLPAGRCGGAWQLYTALVLSVVVLWWWSRRYRWHFWELADVLLPVALVGAVVASVGWGPSGARAAGVGGVGVILAAVTRWGYRRWGWYQSGKVGPVAAVAGVAWAVVVATVANFGLWAVYSLVWVAVLAALVIYLRSGRRLSADVSRLWPKRKTEPKRA